MDFNDTPEEAAFRKEVRTWLDANATRKSDDSKSFRARNDDPELHVGPTSHSWAEAWVPGLDWVGFDPANGISPRGDSLRVAVGLDHRASLLRHGRRPACTQVWRGAEPALCLAIGALGVDSD